MPRSPRTVVKKVLKRLAQGLLLGLVVPLVLAEVALRIADPLGIAYIFEAVRYFAAMKPDVETDYIHAPLLHDRFQGVEVAINSFGLRGPEFGRPKPPGLKRLVLLGDSMVFGWGVEERDTFAGRLRAKLAPQWEVVAAGVGSWNARTEREFLRSRWNELQPDAIVWLLVENDVEPHAGGRRDVPVAAVTPPPPLTRIQRMTRSICEHSYLATSLRWIVASRQTSSRALTFYDASAPEWQDARLAVSEVASACREQGVPLIACVWADGRTPSSRVSIERWTTAAREEGLEAHVFPEAAHARALRNSRVDGHPNAAGHAILAATMMDALTPVLASGSVAASP